MRRWLLAISLAGTAAAQEPPTLEELAEVARARFEADQPKQLKALQPFVEDLKIVYGGSNREWLDQRFKLAAALGDSIVPALLRWLSPGPGSSPEAIVVSENSARILLRIDPSGFADSLIEIAQGENYIGRKRAIWLLGHTRNEEAIAVLTRLLEQPDTAQRVTLVHALKQMGAREPAAEIAAFLNSKQPELVDAALDYLAAVQPPATIDAVITAMNAGEASNESLRFYVRYLVGAAPGNARAADALLRQIQPGEIYRERLLGVVRALARVAPRGHKPTISRCEAIIDLGGTQDLALACAATMKTLGDRSGFVTLEKRLTTLIRRDRSKDDHFVSRANLFRALDRWREASNDYQEAIERTENRGLKRDLYLLVATCEAELGRWSNLLKALKKSNASYQTIMFAARESEALTKGLNQRAIRKFLDELPRQRSRGSAPRPSKR